MSAYAWLAKLNIPREAACRCGHNAHVHLHGKSCTAVIDESRMRYCKCEVFHLAIRYENQVEGENEMTKKAKHVKKQARTPRGEKLYEAFASKINAHAIGKKVADKKCEQHVPIVARVLLNFDKSVDLERVIAAAKNAGYPASATKYVVMDLAFLVREGLAKVTVADAPKSVKPKHSAKPRKPRVAIATVTDGDPLGVAASA